MNLTIHLCIFWIHISCNKGTTERMPTNQRDSATHAPPERSDLRKRGSCHTYSYPLDRSRRDPAKKISRLHGSTAQPRPSLKYSSITEGMLNAIRNVTHYKNPPSIPSPDSSNTKRAMSNYCCSSSSALPF